MKIIKLENKKKLHNTNSFILRGANITYKILNKNRKKNQVESVTTGQLLLIIFTASKKF